MGKMTVKERDDILGQIMGLVKKLKYAPGIVPSDCSVSVSTEIDEFQSWFSEAVIKCPSNRHRMEICLRWDGKVNAVALGDPK